MSKFSEKLKSLNPLYAHAGSFSFLLGFFVASIVVCLLLFCYCVNTLLLIYLFIYLFENLM